MITTTTLPITSTIPQPTALTPANGSASGAGSSTFGAILDAINPLQHIPVVSSLVRAASGTSISPVAQVAGDTLYGGLLGGALSSFLGSLTDVAVKNASGESISEHVLSGLKSQDSSPTTATALVPATLSDADPTAAVTPATQVDGAVQSILRNDIHPERVAGQYQRAQTLDVAHKLLVKTI